MIVRELINLIGFKINDAQLRAAEKQVDVFVGKMDHIGKQMSLMFTAPFVGLTYWLAKTLSEFEQLDIAFQTIVGDTDRAKQLVEDMHAFAKVTPFEIKEIGPTVKMLLAMGASVDEVLDELKMLGDVSAGLGVPISRLALNFGQVRAQSKLTGRELRDFAIAGVPILSELAKMLNKSEAAITDMISAGEIGFPEVKEAFRRMSSEGGRFNNLMMEQAKTLGGLWSNFLDTLTLSAKQFEKTLLPVFKKIVMALIKIVDFINEKTSPTLKAIVFWMFAIVAAVGPVLVLFASLVGIGMAVAKVFSILTIAAAAQNLAVGGLILKYLMLMALWVAIAALIALLIEDFIMYTKGEDSLFGLILPKWDSLKEKIDSARIALENFGHWLFVVTDKWKDFWGSVGTGLFKMTNFLENLAVSTAGKLGIDATRERLALDAQGKLTTVPTYSSVQRIEVNSTINTTVPEGTPEFQKTALSKTAQQAVQAQFTDEVRNLLLAGRKVE